MFVVIALLPLLVAVLLLLVLHWNVCDAGWTTLGVTIALVSLVPPFHCTPWQIALSFGEGMALMMTVGIVLLPFSMQRTYLVPVQMKGARQLLLSVLAMGSFFATGVLMQDSGMVALLAKAVTMPGNYAVWIATLVGTARRWLWPGSVIACLVLLIVHAPLLSTSLDWCRSWLRKNHVLLRLFLSPSQTKSTQHGWPGAPGWMMQVLAYGGLLLVNLLYASFSLVSVDPLSRLDPVLFVCFQMLLLTPFGLVFFLSARTQLQQADIQRGVQLGGFLSAGLLCYTLSLRDTGMTEAMMFSALNGGVATLIAWKFLGQRISTLSRWACLCALGGACLVWAVSPAKWQGECMALVGGLLLTGYAFHVERLLEETQQRHQAMLPIIGVQLLTMALITTVIALCFGQWGTLHRFAPSDLGRLVYVSLATILLPCLLMLRVQRMLSAVTVAFFSVAEPLAGGCMACFSFGERLPALAYLGGGMVIAGIVFQVVGETRGRNVP